MIVAYAYIAPKTRPTTARAVPPKEPRAAAEPREEKAEKPRQDRPKRDGTKPPKADVRGKSRRDEEEADEPGVWNGPVPSFLGVSAL